MSEKSWIKNCFYSADKLNNAVFYLNNSANIYIIEHQDQEGFSYCRLTDDSTTMIDKIIETIAEDFGIEVGNATEEFYMLKEQNKVVFDSLKRSAPNYKPIDVYSIEHYALCYARGVVESNADDRSKVAQLFKLMNNNIFKDIISEAIPRNDIDALNKKVQAYNDISYIFYAAIMKLIATGEYTLSAADIRKIKVQNYVEIANNKGNYLNIPLKVANMLGLYLDSESVEEF